MIIPDFAASIYIIKEWKEGVMFAFSILIGIAVGVSGDACLILVGLSWRIRQFFNHYFSQIYGIISKSRNIKSFFSRDVERVGTW